MVRAFILLIGLLMSVNAVAEPKVVNGFTYNDKWTYFNPAVSNGSAPFAQIETDLDFDDATDERVQFQIALPSAWELGAISFRAWWTSTATDADGVARGLQCVGVDDGSTIDVAYGEAVVVTDDHQFADEDLLVTAELYDKGLSAGLIGNLAP